MKPMFWKFYFWVVLSLDLIAFVTPLGLQQDRRVWETIDMGVFLLAFIGLFGFCWGKQMLSRLFWQVFLVCLLLWIGCYVFAVPAMPLIASRASSLHVPSQLISSLAIVPHLPLIVALYLYSFKSDDLWR
jgi:hypothetical protein